MKFIKVILILLFISVSSSYAQDAIVDTMGQEAVIESSMVTPIAVENNTVEEVSERSEFMSILSKFVSSGILAFILCLLFPKFLKKTSEVLVNRNKFRILFEGMKSLFVLLTIFFLGIFLIIGVYPGAIAASLVMGLYFLGLPVFSIGILEWLFNRKNINFNKLNKKNKLVSLLSINIIIMMFVLPLALLVPGIKLDSMYGIVEIDILSNFLTFILSLFGIGIFVIHLTEVVKKNQKKL